jgi:hypothetical protein
MAASLHALWPTGPGAARKLVCSSLLHQHHFMRPSPCQLVTLRAPCVLRPTPESGLSGTPAFWLACSPRRAACSTLATLGGISNVPPRLSSVNSSLDVHVTAAHDSRRLERIGHGADLVESKDEGCSGRHDPCGAACPSGRVSGVLIRRFRVPFDIAHSCTTAQGPFVNAPVCISFHSRWCEYSLLY